MTLVFSFIYFSLFLVLLVWSSVLMTGGGSFMSYSLWLGNFDMDLCLVMDSMSLGSAVLVLFISGCVNLFSHSYMSRDVNSDRFIFLLAGFVASMVMLLFSCSIPMLLVGWDGLGVTSFMLIVYYDSKSNNRSGMITFSINRLGDAILISSLVFFVAEGSLFMSGWQLSGTLAVTYMLVSMTKSAQYPFCMWLPLAMDAPTPVSALVHSSTLVTAGLFLMARVIPESFNPYLLFIGGSTLCVGGFCATFSSDLKKLIANSTLSNLGLMAFILSLSNKSLMLFHLYTHALFKAGLFIVAGAMLMNSFGVQDSRGLYGSGKNSPLLGSLLSAFFVSSMGLFFMSTFFSKHEITLAAQMLAVNLVSIIMMSVGVFFTAIYSMRFSYIILSSNLKISLSSSTPTSVMLSVGLLSGASVVFGNTFNNCMLSPLFCFEVSLANISAFLGLMVFMGSSNKLSSNMSKSMLQTDSVMDSMCKYFSNMKYLQSTDMGYGSVENKGMMDDFNKVSSLMIAPMSANRVNLSTIILGTCLMLAFL